MKTLFKDILGTAIIFSFLTGTALAGGSSAGVYETNVRDKFLTAGESDQLLMSFTVEPWEQLPGDLNMYSLSLTCTPAQGFESVSLKNGNNEIDSAEFESNATGDSLTALFNENDFLIPNGEATAFGLYVDVAPGTGDFITACALDYMVFYNLDSEIYYESNRQAVGFDGLDRLVYVDDPEADNRAENTNVFMKDLNVMNLQPGSKDNILANFSINASEDVMIKDLFLYCDNAGSVLDAGRLSVDAGDGSEVLVFDPVAFQNDSYTQDKEYSRVSRLVFSGLDVVTGLGSGVEFILYGDMNSAYGLLPDTEINCSVIDVMAEKIDEESDVMETEEAVDEAIDQPEEDMPEMTFSDLDENHPNYEAVEDLFARGIVEGYANGTFMPDININRAELMKILVESVMGTPDESVYNSCFSDVHDEWFAKYVCRAKDLGWIEGYSDGSFKPANSVNNVEALKMVIEVTGIGVDPVEGQEVPEVMSGDVWYVPYVNKAYNFGMLDECTDQCAFIPGSLSTRGEVSEYIYRADQWLGTHI